MYRIEAVLQALKTRLNDDGEMQVQSMNGYMYQGLFTFHPPALEEQIDDLKKSFGEDLPADYVAFLRLHNGMEMFGSKQYGGAIRFYSAQECIAQHAVFKDIYEILWIFMNLYGLAYEFAEIWQSLYKSKSI